MKRDEIDEILHGKLHDMQPGGGAPSWDKLERKLRQKPNSRKYWYYGAGSSAVAATIATFILLSSPQITPPPPTKDKSEKPSFTATTSQIDTEDGIIDIVSKTDSDTYVKSLYASSSFIERATAKNDDSVVLHITETIVEPTKHEEEKANAAKEAINNDVKEIRGNHNHIAYYDDNDPKEKPRKLISVAAYANIPNQNGELTGSTNYDKELYRDMSPGLMAVQVGKHQEIISLYDSELTHKFPITIGISASLPIAKNLAIESGLTYTYLESTKSGHNFKYTQSVHYLGIPVSASYKILNSKAMDLYVSAGGMAEIALSSIGKTEFTGLTSKTTVERKQVAAEGLQMSANAAAGLNVHLTKNLGLYIEPGISHYFKNSKQPVTSRSQSDIQFNLRAGFKIQL